MIEADLFMLVGAAYSVFVLSLSMSALADVAVQLPLLRVDGYDCVPRRLRPRATGTRTRAGLLARLRIRCPSLRQGQSEQGALSFSRF